jgi:hypothetical protein
VNVWIVSKADWPGTKEELRQRVEAFVAALKAHSKTVGEPAPQEVWVVERLAKSGEEFDCEVIAPPPEAKPVDPEVEARLAKDAAEATRMAEDMDLKAFVDMSPEEVDAWFDANVRDVAAARAAMKKMTKLLVVVARGYMRTT